MTDTTKTEAPQVSEKRAPVQGYPGGIPWAIHLEAYEVYCRRWGAQPALIDLEGRNCRGGFSTGELDDFIPGWRDRVAEFGKLKTEVQQLRSERDRLAAECEALRAAVLPALQTGLETALELLAQKGEAYGGDSQYVATYKDAVQELRGAITAAMGGKE